MRSCMPRGTRSLPAVYLLFACSCPQHVSQCQAPWACKVPTMANPCAHWCPLAMRSPKGALRHSLAPLAMPRHSHFLTVCQEYPGGQNCCCHFPLSLQPTRWHKTHINMAVGPPPTTQAPTVAIGAPKAHMGGIYCPA